MNIKSRSVAEVTGWDQKTQENDLRTGHLGFVPKAQGKYRHWTKRGLIAAFAYLDQRRMGETVKIAGQRATKLHEGMRDYPDADQLTIITLENGFSSIHPTADLDLATGCISGGYLASALTFDCRNLRRRVERDFDLCGAEGQRQAVANV